MDVLDLLDGMPRRGIQPQECGRAGDVGKTVKVNVEGTAHQGFGGLHDPNTKEIGRRPP